MGEVGSRHLHDVVARAADKSVVAAARGERHPIGRSSTLLSAKTEIVARASDHGHAAEPGRTSRGR